MERRKAIMTAAAVSLTLLAGAAGIALNSGIVDTSGDDKVGQISPIDTNPPVTVYVDDLAGTTAVTPAPPVPPTGSEPAASGDHDDDRYEDDDDRYEDDDDRYEDEGDDDHGEYEGADDDD
jgi:hypothetical protein